MRSVRVVREFTAAHGTAQGPNKHTSKNTNGDTDAANGRPWNLSAHATDATTDTGANATWCDLV